MKIYNQDKTQVLENPDLKKGYLMEDKIVVKTIPATEEVQEQFHYEYKDYPSGGRDRIKVVDVAYEPAKPETYEYEDIQVYVLFTEEELKQNRIRELKTWFEEYDNQVKQYQRCVRLGIKFDKDIVELDNQAKAYQEELRILLGKEPRIYN